MHTALVQMLPFIGNIGFSDMVFDFSGTKYAVKFAATNDSGVSALGLYKNVIFKDVTEENLGWDSFKSYSEIGVQGRGSMGALPLQNNYFSWTAIRSVPMSIRSGIKIADITLLTQAQLQSKGLNFSGNGISSGVYTFGFSFQMIDSMRGNFLAYFFTECINDGLAIIVRPQPACQ